MKLNHLLAAAAALALAGGASASAQQKPNQSTPPEKADTGTGIPSPDSTRPTGANAGATNLPNGEVTGAQSQPAAPEATVSSTVTTEAPAPATDTTTSSTTSTSSTATAATTAGAPASFTTAMVTNGPVPDTAENRAKYGQPMSRAGKRTAAKGN